MDKRVTTLERAYQLARSGKCRGVAQIKDRLRVEGYADIPSRIYGSALLADLRRLCVAARVESAPDA